MKGRVQGALNVNDLGGRETLSSEWQVKQAERTVIQADGSVHEMTLKKSVDAEDKSGKMHCWKLWQNPFSLCRSLDFLPRTTGNL